MQIRFNVEQSACGDVHVWKSERLVCITPSPWHGYCPPLSNRPPMVWDRKGPMQTALCPWALGTVHCFVLCSSQRQNSSPALGQTQNASLLTTQLCSGVPRMNAVSAGVGTAVWAGWRFSSRSVKTRKKDFSLRIPETDKQNHSTENLLNIGSVVKCSSPSQKGLSTW